MWQNYQISEQFPSREEEEALGFPVFARKEYWLLHLNEEQLLPIFEIHNQHKEIRGFWCFYRKDEKLVTPFNAPFFNPYLKESDTKELLLKRSTTSNCKTERFNPPMQITLKFRLGFSKANRT